MGERIRLAHGSGGRLTLRLIEEVFRARFGVNEPPDDSFVTDLPHERIAVTTDAHVVEPIFFPGGDIGRLAICGTVNDLAVQGAVPRLITAAFVLEEGLSLVELDRIVASMAQAAETVGARIVAGDTKVVPKGKGDKVYIVTTGLGVVESPYPLSGSNARPGDVVLVSGPVGEHEMAIIAARSGIALDGDFCSDVAPLLDLAAALWRSCEVHAMRDPTRGGLATTLNEISRQSRVAIEVDERSVPVRPEVLGACELLGFDPLYLACEGRLVAVVPESEAERALTVLRTHPLGREAAVVGRVLREPEARVYLRTGIGGRRILDLLSGEQLPRIC
ncbi:MAG: hydrogenase expression/formation protein HypE [candidate division KSB1 bacterium]|nr:hydrogenase expression/formation protein HypE [candidate division KSB1 bacterium]